MKTKFITPMIMAVILAALTVTPALAAPPGKFVAKNCGLVVRLPQKALVGKNFNIGIYVADSLVETNPGDGSGGDYESAALYISVSGPEGSTCVMWNDWFEFLGETIDSEDDLIVPPHEVQIDPDPEVSGDEYTVYIYSMEYNEAVSKLADVAGWTGNVVCLVDKAGVYTFTLTTTEGTILGVFTISVK